MMKSDNSIYSGFTIVEMMVVVFIFTLMFMATLGTLSTGRQSWLTGNTEIQLQQETRRAMDWMVKELRAAQSLNLLTGNSIKFKVAIDEDTLDTTPDADVLDTSGNIEWGANDETQDNLNWSIEYSFSGSQILRKVFDDADTEYPNLTRVLANHILSLSFTPVSSSVVSIEIIARKDVVRGRDMQAALYSQATLRN